MERSTNASWDPSLEAAAATAVAALRRGEDPQGVARALLAEVGGYDPGTRETSGAERLSDTIGTAEATVPGSVAYLALHCEWLLDGQVQADELREALEALLGESREKVALERYQLQAPLGEGGMGSVFQAWDGTLEREVAVKFLKGPIDPCRLQEEARLMARLEHPNIVTIHDVGRKEGRPYLVMRRIHGKSLDRVIEAGELGSLEERLALFQAIAEAVAYAHSVGVIHRDLKPANVMLDRNGQPQVMDWGIAQLGDRARRRAGTPAYMAPEQLLGDPTDPRTDIYALGELLLGLVSEKPAFEGSPSAVREAKLSGRMSVDRLDPHPELKAIVQRATARWPGQRYYDCEDLITAVEAFRRGRPVPGLRYSPWRRMGKWIRRQRRLITPLATGIVLGGALLGAWTVGQREQTRHWEMLRRAQAQLEGDNSSGAWATLEALPTTPALLAETRELARAALAWKHELPLRRWEPTRGVRVGLPKGNARRVTLSADGTRGLTATQDPSVDTSGSFHLFRIPTFEHLASVPFSATPWAWNRTAVHEQEGRLLGYVLTPDHRIQVWDVASGGIFWQTRARHVPAAPVELKMSTFREGRVVRVFSKGSDSPATDEIYRLGEPAPAEVLADARLIGMSPQGRHRVVMDRTTRQSFLEEMDREAPRRLLDHRCRVANARTLAFSHDGRWLACAKATSGTSLYRTEEGVLTWSGEYPSILGFTPDDRGLLLQSPQGSIHVLALHRGMARPHRILFRGMRQPGAPRGHVSGADAQLLLSSYDAGRLLLHDLSPREGHYSMRPGQHQVPSLAVSPDGKLALLGAGRVPGVEREDSELFLVELGSRKVLRRLNTAAPSAWGVAFSADGRRAISGDHSGAAVLWDLRRGRAAERWTPPTGAILTGAVLLPSGSRALLADTEGTLSLWDLEAGRVTWRHRREPVTDDANRGYWDLDLSPDGRLAATTDRHTQTGEVILWTLDGETPRIRWRQRGALESGENYYRLAFSPDSSRLATVTSHGRAMLFETSGDGSVRWSRDQLLSRAFTAVAFSRTGRLLYTGGIDNLIQVWDAASGEELWHIAAHEEIVNDLQCTPDGRYLLSASDDGTVAIIDLKLPDLQARYDEALEADPDDPAALGRLLALRGRWDLALGYLLQAPPTPSLAPDLARALWHADRPAEALEHLTQMRDEPGFPSDLSPATLDIWMAVLREEAEGFPAPEPSGGE